MEELHLLCLGCMKKKTREGVCPYCGFDEKEYEIRMYQLPLGTILNGKYLIGKVLGEGGFGITYIGWDLNLQIPLAIKEYFPNTFAVRDNQRGNRVIPFTGAKQKYYAKGKESYIEEARILAKFCGEDGIVEVRDYFEENGTAYIVMEYLDGKNLIQILKNIEKNNSHMHPEVVFNLMKPVIKTLNLVHKQDLIHRDISPDNMIMLPNEKIKLIDFGASRDFSKSDDGMSVILKEGYAPEEQHRRDGKQGPWTDVYALCGTMYRAITGRKPEDVMSRVMGAPLKKPSELGIRDINLNQEAVLMRGLEVRRESRIQNMEELYRALYENKSFTWSPLGDGRGMDETIFLNEEEKGENISANRGGKNPVNSSGGGQIMEVYPEDISEDDSGNFIIPILIAWAIVVVILVGGVIAMFITVY